VPLLSQPLEVPQPKKATINGRITPPRSAPTFCPQRRLQAVATLAPWFRCGWLVQRSLKPFRYASPFLAQFESDASQVRNLFKSAGERAKLPSAIRQELVVCHGVDLLTKHCDKDGRPSFMVRTSLAGKEAND
jgi:hypothetical protein